jgi:hypothetical protein
MSLVEAHQCYHCPQRCPTPPVKHIQNQEHSTLSSDLLLLCRLYIEIPPMDDKYFFINNVKPLKHLQHAFLVIRNLEVKREAFILQENPKCREGVILCSRERTLVF